LIDLCPSSSIVVYQQQLNYYNKLGRYGPT
jgi:hypothetical protein